jgi:SlyX protein
MTPQELENRLADLETRVAFQEQALLELSDALAAARAEETRTALLLHRALEELKAIRTTLSSSPVTGDASLEPPPPHY